MAKFDPKFVLIMDWETTGAEFGMPAEKIAQKYQGISVGVIVAEFETLTEVYSDYMMIKYDSSKYVWTERAEQIHGISREMLAAEGVELEEAAERILTPIMDYWGPNGIIIFGAHNAAFDLAFLQEQILKPFNINLEFHQARLDTAVLGLILMGNGKSDYVFEILAGEPGRAEHNALDDARLCLSSLRTAKELFSEILNG